LRSQRIRDERVECKQFFKFRSVGSELNSGPRKKLAKDMNLSLVERRNAYFHDRPHDPVRNPQSIYLIRLFLKWKYRTDVSKFHKLPELVLLRQH
jgi:hypothetical protein